MRRFFSSFRRVIACFLVMSFLTSGVAMASYICPEIAPKQAMSGMMEDMPCAEMDKKKPVHCAEYKADKRLALELASAPTLTCPAIFFVMPAIKPVAPPVISFFWPDAPSDPGSDPPYLRTQRLRI